jgi:hypothetical protein
MAFEIVTQWENMIQLHKIKDFQFKTHAIFTHTFHCSTLKASPTTTSIVFSWNIAWSFL